MGVKRCWPVFRVKKRLAMPIRRPQREKRGKGWQKRGNQQEGSAVFYYFFHPLGERSTQESRF